MAAVTIYFWDLLPSCETQYIYNMRMNRTGKVLHKPKKTVAMTFRFTPQFRERLVEAAERENRSQANLIETLVNSFLAASETPSVGRDSRSSVKTKAIR